ncbi:hypothetical protein JCM8208_007603 [Rhodotorula glutinis]
MALSAYEPGRRSVFSRCVKPFRDPLRAMRAPIDRRDLLALEEHWREVERGEGTTAGYSEPDRRAALQHAVPPLASCWVAVHAPRQATEEAVRALYSSVQVEVEELERRAAERGRAVKRGGAEDVAAEKAYHNAVARLALAQKKRKYLRQRLRRFAQPQRLVGVPLDRERYGNEGPAWARG